MSRPNDLTGQKIGPWEVLKMLSDVKGHGAQFQCRCRCGNISIIKGYRLTGGHHSKGCRLCSGVGQLRRDNLLTYNSWRGMRERCTNPNHIAYPYYGGRGITVCNRWLFSFDNFLNDMGPKPKKTSLDRIDSEGNYEPGNCRWATSTTQGRNTRRNQITDEQAAIIKKALSLGMIEHDIAILCNCGRGVISAIHRGKTWVDQDSQAKIAGFP